MIAGEVLAGRYKLLRYVARRGMGEVWEAEDLSLHEVVAQRAAAAGCAPPR